MAGSGQRGEAEGRVVAGVGGRWLDEWWSVAQSQQLLVGHRADGMREGQGWAAVPNIPQSHVGINPLR